MPLTVQWYYDGAHDSIVVTTTIKAYMLLHLGCLNTAAEVPPALAPADLLKFLQPPLTLPKYETMPKSKPMPELEPEPLPVYKPLPEFEPMSTDLLPLEPILPKVPVIKISSSDSLALASEPLLSDLFDRIHLRRCLLPSVEFPIVVLDVNVLLGPVGYVPRSFPKSVVVMDAIFESMLDEFSRRIDSFGFSVVVVLFIYGCL